MTKQTKSTQVRGEVKYINPDSLPKNPAFANVVTVTGPVKTTYVGGQDAVDPSGAIVGKGDLKAQPEQILKNIQAALAAGGAQLEHVVKWNVYILQGQSVQEGFEAFQPIRGNHPNPTAISVMFVDGLAHPDFLAEMDAIAVVPE